MAKFNPPSINSGYLSTEALNQAFVDISAALENTLSRDGTLPNQMEGDLDLNGNSIVNTALDPTDPNSLATLGQVQSYVDARATGLLTQKIEIQTATALQTVFVLQEFEYAPASHNLAVYVNGIRKFTPMDYTETNSTTVTFLVGQTLGAKVEFVSTDFVSNVALPEHTHPWDQITGKPAEATRWPTYAEVTDKPATFPPALHQHPASDITSGRLADARRGVHVQAGTPTAATVGELWFF